MFNLVQKNIYKVPTISQHLAVLCESKTQIKINFLPENIIANLNDLRSSTVIAKSNSK